MLKILSRLVKLALVPAPGRAGAAARARAQVHGEFPLSRGLPSLESSQVHLGNLNMFRNS